MLPPLLLQPRSFALDPNCHRRLQQKLCAGCTHSCNQSNGMIAISENRANDTFFISSICKSSVVEIASVLAMLPSVRVGTATLVILTYPHHICLLNAGGRSLTTDRNTPPKSSSIDASSTREAYRWIPFKWSQACGDVISARAENQYMYTSVTKACVAANELTAVRALLAKSLFDNEALELAYKVLQHSVSEKIRHVVQRRDEALKREQVLTNTIIRLKSTMTSVRAEYQELRATVNVQLAQFARAMSAVECNQLAQLAKIAVQCAHYFSHDRFSSLYFRQQLVRDKFDREGLPLETLAKFPLVCALIADNDPSLMLGAACALLDKPIHDGTVWF